MTKLCKIDIASAYQTTDGRKFTGENAKENAEDHQRYLDNTKDSVPEECPKHNKKKLSKLLDRLIGEARTFKRRK